MKRLIPFFAFFLLALPGGSFAADYQDSGTSSVVVDKDSQGNVFYRITTTSFDVAQISNDGRMLMKKTTVETITENTEGSRGQLTVSARKTVRKPFDTQAWTIKEDAHDAAYAGDDLYLTWLSGCCAEATTYRAFDVNTGKLLFSYDENTGAQEQPFTSPFVIEAPNTSPSLVRFMGVLTQSATRDFKSATLDGMQKIATVSYSANDRVIQRFDVFGTIPAGWAMNVETSLVDLSTNGSNEIFGNRMTLWTADGVSNPSQAFNTFALKVKATAESGAEITIPFAQDRADLARATVPAGFKLVPAN